MDSSIRHAKQHGLQRPLVLQFWEQHYSSYVHTGPSQQSQMEGAAEKQEVSDIVMEKEGMDDGVQSGVEEEKSCLYAARNSEN